ncbi:hypothetical protein KSP40_PGU016132 [Platanthera guangdongensis]|uniref:Uncharacterized protein n=1 Tax=Platanthera guangdongensis TaxID=2320717 RepID=A0ABR2LK13_9ASPA
MCLPSTLNFARGSSWRKRFSILEDVEIVIASPLEHVQRPPSGYFGITEGCLKEGFWILPLEEAIVILRFCGVPVMQFFLVWLTRIMGLLCFFREHGSRMSVRLFASGVGSALAQATVSKSGAIKGGCRLSTRLIIVMVGRCMGLSGTKGSCLRSGMTLPTAPAA